MDDEKVKLFTLSKLARIKNNHKKFQNQPREQHMTFADILFRKKPIFPEYSAYTIRSVDTLHLDALQCKDQAAFGADRT